MRRRRKEQEALVNTVRIPSRKEGLAWTLVRDDHTCCRVVCCRNRVAQPHITVEREDGKGKAWYFHGSGYCQDHEGRAAYSAAGVPLTPRAARALGRDLTLAVRKVCGGDELLLRATLACLTQYMC